jgi:hypothetical protein
MFDSRVTSFVVYILGSVPALFSFVLAHPSKRSVHGTWFSFSRLEQSGKSKARYQSSLYYAVGGGCGE